MSKITVAESGAEGLTRFAVGWLVQFILKWPFFPHRKHIGGGLPCPSPLAVPVGGGLFPELDDLPVPGPFLFPFPLPLAFPDDLP